MTIRLYIYFNINERSLFVLNYHIRFVKMQITVNLHSKQTNMHTVFIYLCPEKLHIKIFDVKRFWSLVDLMLRRPLKGQL